MLSAFAHTGRALSRCLLLPILIGFFLTALAGCARFGSHSGDPKMGPVWVRVELDKQTYRPGEMVVCTVELVNPHPGPLVIQEPICSHYPRYANLNFLFCDNMETGHMLYRAPVIVREPQGSGADTYAPPLTLPEQWKGSKTKYAFVNLTGQVGEFKILARYSVSPVRETALGRRSLKKMQVYSEAMTFKVEGDPLFTRNPNGLISKADAQRAALLQYDPHAERRFQAMRAALVQPQEGMDMLDWWVAFDRDPTDIRPGEAPSIAFYVSPYGGFVRSEAEPFSKNPLEFLRERSLNPNPQRPPSDPENPLNRLAPVHPVPATGPAPAASPAPAKAAPIAGGGSGAGR